VKGENEIDRRIKALESELAPQKVKVFREPTDLSPAELAAWRAEMQAECAKDGITTAVVVHRYHTPTGSASMHRVDDEPEQEW